MDPIAVPAGLVGGLAILAFGVTLLAVFVTPVMRRMDRLAELRGLLVLVPYALLLVAAGLAVAASALGTVSAQHVGVREVVTASLAVLCVTPVVGVLIVRLRYGSTGTRTFYQQIAANRVSSVLLVAVLFEVVAITGFLIGAGIGIGFGAALICGLVVAAVALAITTGATAFSLHHGDQFILNLSGAKPAHPRDRQVLLNVVAELALAAAIPVPAVYVIESPAMNAMSIGRDPAHASIAVTRGLLERLDREELQGVVAHELAHIANFDSRHALLVALLVGAVVVMTELFLHLMLEIASNPWVGGDSISGMVGSLAVWLVITVVGLVFALTLRLFAPFAALAVQAAVSRDREYLADATAVGITRNPAGLIAALGELDHANAAIPGASGGTQHLWIVNPVRESHEGGRGWLATHPPTLDRIDRLRSLAGRVSEAEPLVAPAAE